MSNKRSIPCTRVSFHPVYDLTTMEKIGEVKVDPLRQSCRDPLTTFTP